MSDPMMTVRAMGRTEHSWCKAVSCGTGTTVLSLLLSKPPNTSHLHNALQKLLNSHPILTAKITYSAAAAFSLTISSAPPSPPPFQLNSFPLSSTSNLLQTPNNNDDVVSLSPLHIIHEHEMNINPWSIPNLSSSSSSGGVPVFFVTVYELPEGKWAVVLRIHTAVCDRTTAVGVLRELKELMAEVEEGAVVGIEMEKNSFGKVNLGIEDLVPVGKTKKAIWAHGLDVLGYSVKSLRFTNLKFKDVSGPRSSQLARLQLTKQETSQILANCKLRGGIKLCGALAAAGLMSANSGDPLRHNRHNNYSNGNKYAIVTLTDCRSELQPPLSSHHFGFYHSAILNMHVIKRGETVWDLAERIYTSLSNSKHSNKHLTDMSDLNFLMSKVIDNPSLTPHSSMRTSLMCVFEETVVDNSETQFGLQDYIGSGSAHGVGPSIAVFDTIRNGELDVAFVYPSPLHSREQMGRMVEEMKMHLLGKVE